MKKQGYVIVAAAIGLITIAALLIRQKASAQILVPAQRVENNLVPVSPHFVEMKLDENTSILVETLDSIPIIIENRSDGSPQRSIRDYPTFIRQIEPIVGGIVKAVRGGAGEPDEINIELGIGVSGGTTLALVNLNGQANLKVSVTWRKEKK